MAILLTIEESEEEIISGFPEYIILESNVPSTIFYTLDGTDPDINSPMFVDKIVLPTTGMLITLKAVAISDDSSSAILEKDYFTSQSNLDKTRFINREGINILPYGEEAVDSLSFDYEGNPTQETSIDIVDLDLRGSTSNKRGEDIPGDTTLDFVNFAIKQNPVLDDYPISSPNNNYNFNPRAQYIIIDGSTQEALDSQVVRIINRQTGTFELNSSIHYANMDSYQLNTSNLVRYMINPKTGQTTFYYRDSRENRWLKSHQKIDGNGLKISTSEAPPSSFVFRWVETRSGTNIF